MLRLKAGPKPPGLADTVTVASGKSLKTMPRFQLPRRQFLLAATPMLAAGWAAAQIAARVPATDIPAAKQTAPAALAKQLQAGGTKPVILQVGFEKLYAEAHIPGSIYAGPARNPEGLTALRAAAAKYAKDQRIVIYCVCCPWTRCPNMGAAYQALTAAGYTNVEALYIADNFGADWVKPGYPVTHAS